MTVLQVILYYLAAMNLLGFFFMGLDKWKAKKRAWRIPHLKSIGLTDADKALYKQTFRNVPDSKQELRSEINDVKSQLLSKLAVAFRDRAAQANTDRKSVV